jgi:hypothetical protein
MPKIIIEADRPGDERERAVHSERLVTANLESPHYTTQLIERLVWAVADAETIESRLGATVTGRTDSRPASGAESRRRRRGSPLAKAATLVASVLLFAFATVATIASTAVARTGQRHDRVDVQKADIASGVALHWYDVTTQTVAAAALPEPVTQSRVWAVSWLAAARALDGPGHDPSYQVAAFAQALHDTLAAQVPGQQAELDNDLAITLSEVPNSPAKQDGIAAGREQASAVLAERAGDGLDTASVDTPFATPAPGPGVWRPTPPAFAPALRAGEGYARPFLLAAGDQFDPGPPPALDSARYVADLAEVRAYGSDDSAVRTPAQTDIALFWEPAINVQLVQIVRALVADSNRPLARQARFVAAFNVITTDAQIAIYNAKYKYLFWRPVTAIRTGSVDPDPSWTPLFTTPRYPDWPSGHGGVAGAAQEILTTFVGPDAPAPIAVTSPTDPGTTRTYESWSALTREVIDARVWEGIHFRFSDVTGADVGREVARYDLRHLRSIGL